METKDLNCNTCNKPANEMKDPCMGLKEGKVIIYCSDECRKNGTKLYITDKHKISESICDFCSNRFTANTNWQRFCSNNCRIKDHRSKKIKMPEKEITCSNCKMILDQFTAGMKMISMQFKCGCGHFNKCKTCDLDYEHGHYDVSSIDRDELIKDGFIPWDNTVADFIASHKEKLNGKA